MECQAETTTCTSIECYNEPLDAYSHDEWDDFFSSVDENKTSSKLSVSFNGSITVVECLHRNDYSKKESKATWYSPKEMEKNQESYRKAIRQMASGKNNTKEMCTRGLEQRTAIGAKKRHRNKNIGWNAVEQEQIHQWENGFADAEPVADVYIAATQDCVKAAVNLGNEDRKVVLEQENDDLGNSNDKHVAGLFNKHSWTIISSLVSVQAFGPLSRAA